MVVLDAQLIRGLTKVLYPKGLNTNGAVNVSRALFKVLDWVSTLDQ